MRAGLHRHAHFELVSGVAVGVRAARPRSVNSLSCSPSIVTSSCCRRRPAAAADVDLDLVFAVDREQVADERPAARAERQASVAIVLLRVGRHAIDIAVHAPAADCPTARRLIVLAAAR